LEESSSQHTAVRQSNSSEKGFELTAYIFIGLGSSALIYLLFRLWGQYQLRGAVDLSATAQFGDYIGGVVGAFWSLAGVLLFYASLKSQQNALETQRGEFELQKKELKLQRAELHSQRQEYATMRVIEVIYRQLEMLFKKSEALSLTIPSAPEERLIAGQLVIHEFTRHARHHLKPQPIFQPTEPQIRHIEALYTFTQSRTTKEYLRYLNLTVDVCIKLVEQQEHKTASDSEDLLLDKDTRLNLYLILDGNLATKQHLRYLNMMKRALKSNSQLRQQDNPNMPNRYLPSEQSQIDLIGDLTIKLKSIISQLQF